MRFPKISLRFVLLIFSILFLLAAAILFRSVIATATRHGWEPLNESISLAKGKIVTLSFVSDRSQSYELDLMFERKIESGRLECLLGISLQQAEKCKDIPSILDIEWSVIGNDGVKISGTRTPQSKQIARPRGQTTRVLLGEFRVEANRPYRIELKINTDASELNIAHPRVRVHVDSRQNKNAIASAQIKGLAILVLTSLGVVLLISYAMIAIYETRRDS